MLTGLFDDVVLDGDGAATGIEFLVSRLGACRVGELHLILRDIELAALDRRLIRKFGVTGVVAEFRRGNGEGDSICRSVGLHLVAHKILAVRKSLREHSYFIATSVIVSRRRRVRVLIQQVFGGTRHIAHASGKGIDDIKRIAAELGGAIVIPAHRRGTVRIDRPADNPSALFIRAVDRVPVEVLIPFCNSFRCGLFHSRARRLVVNDIGDYIGKRRLPTLDSNGSEIRIPTR